MKICLPLLPLPGHSLPVRHYGVFPKSLAQIISHYDVAEVHLSLTQGQWRTNAWGYPPRSSPRGRSCGRGLWLEQGQTDIVQHLPVHLFLPVTLNCSKHTNYTYIHSCCNWCTCSVDVRWKGWPTPCLVSRVPLSTSSTLPPPSSRCFHSDPEEQWLVSSEATLPSCVGRRSLWCVRVSSHQNMTSSLAWNWQRDPSPNLFIWTTDCLSLHLHISPLLCLLSPFPLSPLSLLPPPFPPPPYHLLAGNLSEDHLCYAALPRETVCTENFTPWKKLLPCDN